MAAASGATVARRRRASGPWTATMARRSVVSVPPMADTTRSVLEALGITSKTSSSTHQTMMSSTTEASSSSRRWVYWARPGPMRRRSLDSETWSRSNASGTLDPHRAQMAHVEGHRPCPTGPVLGQRPVRIGQRHLPPAELDQLGSETAVGSDQGRLVEAPCAAVRARGCAARGCGGHAATLNGVDPMSDQAGRATAPEPPAPRPSPTSPYLASNASVSRWYSTFTRISG